MKKILLSVAAVFAISFANAQEDTSFGFSQGDVILEGQVQFGTTKEGSGNSEIKSISFNFSPKVGYFIADRFVVGAGLNFRNEKQERAGRQVSKSDLYGFDVFGRHYFVDLGKRFKVYGEADLAFGFSKTEGANSQSEFKSTHIDFGVGIGVNYFLTNRFAINVGLSNLLGFNYEKPKGGDASTSFALNLNEFSNVFRENATFGLTFIF